MFCYCSLRDAINMIIFPLFQVLLASDLPQIRPIYWKASPAAAVSLSGILIPMDTLFAHYGSVFFNKTAR